MHRKVTLETLGDERLFTILTEPSIPQDKLVIMCHGFRGSSTGPARAFVNFESLLLEDGFSCLRFDQIGCGNSTGDFADSSFNAWVETISWLGAKYLHSSYRVALLGQSMGATAVVAASVTPELQGRIPCLALWVPDPKSDVVDVAEVMAEEDGQVYPTRFWSEARDSAFFDCLAAYEGGTHLVYGEHDRYVSAEQRTSVIDSVGAKGQPSMVLSGQNHSPWSYDAAQSVFAAEREFLARYF